MLPPPRPPLGPPRRRHLLPPHTAPRLPALPPPPAPRSPRESLRAGPAGSSRGGVDAGGAPAARRKDSGRADICQGLAARLPQRLGEGTISPGGCVTKCSGVTIQLISKFPGFKRRKRSRLAPERGCPLLLYLEVTIYYLCS
ncbi:potassium voltage-gated channel subfamily C member 3-like isoform X2 [Falco biarmicus]|uniref:potassium voltage-gated channel subfamily C member 3-like isoform X2 n=1 Tax=Falco biarmicus TaxID=345155 RepID=UPI0024BD1DBC|nr:potassium voltage-gated channel subfamily C member 3-like isoform X2 [Falco biarmicus]